jgi:hypothetical protein
MATLAEYMQWLRGIGGKCRTGIGADPEIGMVPVTLLEAPSGEYVIHGDDKQHAQLSQNAIDYFDRRLRLTSPWNSQNK